MSPKRERLALKKLERDIGEECGNGMARAQVSKNLRAPRAAVVLPDAANSAYGRAGGGPNFLAECGQARNRTMVSRGCYR